MEISGAGSEEFALKSHLGLDRPPGLQSGRATIDFYYNCVAIAYSSLWSGKITKAMAWVESR